MSITKLTTNGVNGTKYDIASADNYYMEPIATTLLGSAAASVTFSGIPQTYKHLQIRTISRTASTASDADNLGLQFNGDTNANYATHFLYGDGATAFGNGVTGDTKARTDHTAASLSTASVFGVGFTDILDYANVYKYKTTRALSGVDRNGSGIIMLRSALWMNTAAINSIVITTVSGSNLSANTRISLYGVKA